METPLARTARLAFVVCALAPLKTFAVTIQTVGAGSAVTSTDRTALFSSLVNAADLSAYTENGLSITTPGNSTVAPFDAFNGAGDGSALFYADNGNYDWVTIRTTDGKRIAALEFLYGNGFDRGTTPTEALGTGLYGHDGATVDWRTFIGATLVSSGSTINPGGTILGFSDSDGFDSLQIRATLYNTPPNFQAIALDSLHVQIDYATVIPPETPSAPDIASTFFLLLTGVCGVVGASRKSRG